MTKTYLLKDIPDNLWKEFKNKIPRDKTINSELLDLIENKVGVEYVRKSI